MDSLERFLLASERAARCEHEVDKTARWHFRQFFEMLSADCVEDDWRRRRLAHAQGPLMRKASRARTRRKARAVVRQLFTYHWGCAIDLERSLRALDNPEGDDDG